MEQYYFKFQKYNKKQLYMMYGRGELYDLTIINEISKENIILNYADSNKYKIFIHGMNTLDVQVDNLNGKWSGLLKAVNSWIADITDMPRNKNTFPEDKFPKNHNEYTVPNDIYILLKDKVDTLNAKNSIMQSHKLILPTTETHYTTETLEPFKQNEQTIKRLSDLGLNYERSTTENYTNDISFT